MQKNKKIYKDDLFNWTLAAEAIARRLDVIEQTIKQEMQTRQEEVKYAGKT